MREENCELKCDPYEMVKDLADTIGIDNLYEIVIDMKDGGSKEVRNLKMQIKELEAGVSYQGEKIARMKGAINAFAFVIRCNGISGENVRYDRFD